MIETIGISALTKSYIDNHDVMCGGVHCKYQETEDRMTGEIKKEYVVLNSQLDFRFGTIKQLKEYIRTSGMENNIVSKTGLVLQYEFTSHRGQKVYSYESMNHSRIYAENSAGGEIELCEKLNDGELEDRLEAWKAEDAEEKKAIIQKRQTPTKNKPQPKPQTKKPNQKTVIDQQINKGRQDVIYTLIEECQGKRFKFSIKSDSYDFQSYANVSLWNGEAWHQVNTIHHKEMRTPHKLAYRQNGCEPHHFLADVRKLRTTAHAVVL